MNKFLDAVGLALSSIWANKLRSFMMVLGNVVAVSSIIAVVALLVLGPERLPKAARLAGLWVRKARAQWYSVKSELERELEVVDV